QWNQFVVLVTLIAFLLAVLMWYIYRFNRSVILLEQYKNAIDDSMIVSKTDRKGVITYVNPNFVAVSGYDEEDLLGKPHSIVRHPDTPASVFKEMWSTIRKGKNWQGVLQNRTKAGKSYYVQSLIAPIVDENGEILEYMGLREDITEIENSRLEAHEAQRIKAAFVANMSHEIRTPINGIVGFVHLLSKSHLDAVQRRYVSIIESSLESLMHIVNDVLDFSKIEEGKIELDIVECAPKAPLDAVYELFSPQAGVKQIDYTLVMDDRLYGCLMLDMLRIKQVISNLISNALKFTPEEGAVTFKIEVVEDTASHQMLRFSVIDTGIGIPKEKQDKIFEKFTQADVSTTRQFGGTGLGLSIANAMVSLMGGVLRVHSEEGKGSTFSFELNAQKCDTFQETAAALENDSLNTAAVPLSMSILVADDYEINQMLIGELLRYHYGIQADFAHNGEEAVERVRHHRYDLVLMDINMPVMDGIEATRIILSEDPTLTIVALTANVLEEDREKFQRAGMKDCLMKPLDLDALHQVLMHVHDIREKE
ncbi:MAG TPA: ATP-binding protein, partial [Sulfuricurvum sp.]|nr:ATP-binding protein [Sulfuricurvum sp.]